MLTGLVLAGGRGRRMGSVDKGLQPLRDAPLVAHVLQRLEPQVATVMISANRHLDRYAGFGHPVVVDTVAQGVGDETDGHAGPLAGLLAGLRCCRTPYLAVVPCDEPFVPTDLVARLSRALDGSTPDAGSDADVAVAAVGGRLHPVFCLVRRSCADDLAAYLADGQRAAGRWIARVRGRAVSFDDDPDAFRNLNTLDDLRAAERDLDG